MNRRDFMGRLPALAALPIIGALFKQREPEPETPMPIHLRGQTAKVSFHSHDGVFSTSDPDAIAAMESQLAAQREPARLPCRECGRTFPADTLYVHDGICFLCRARMDVESPNPAAGLDYWLRTNSARPPFTKEQFDEWLAARGNKPDEGADDEQADVSDPFTYRFTFYDPDTDKETPA